MTNCQDVHITWKTWLFFHLLERPLENTCIRDKSHQRSICMSCLWNEQQVYTHTYIHTYIHTCMHTYIHTYMHTYIHACIHTYIHTHMNVCMYVCMFICMYVCTCMYVCQGLSRNASSVSFGHAEHCFLTVWTPKSLCQNLLKMTFLRR